MLPAEALVFEMSSSRRPGSGVCNAVITVTHSSSFKGEHGWRAVLRVDAEKHRHFGTWASTIDKTVRGLLKAHSHRIAPAQRARVLEQANEMEMRRQRDAAAPSQGVRQDNGVKIVHQIYGLFGDEPMSSLFAACREKWEEVAERMSAHYHLWNADELEALVKHKYPQYWDMYVDVRYPVMRCDIGRIIILHAYGGLYADLDTEPNRHWYEQVELALPRIKLPRKTGLSAKDKRESNHTNAIDDKDSWLDMEVIVGTRGNDFFIRWLNYISQEISNKNYKGGGFWATAKMRYIYHTTGPKCMNRFLRLACNAEWLAAKPLHYLQCNHFKDAGELTAQNKRGFDVISYESNSYFTDEHEIHVPVGDGDTPIPQMLIYRRMRSKVASGSATSRVKNNDAPVARSQEDASTPAQREEAASSASSTAAAREIATLTLQNQTLVHELAACKAREDQLKRHFQTYKNSVSTRIILEDMPADLACWLKQQ